MTGSKQGMDLPWLRWPDCLAAVGSSAVLLCHFSIRFILGLKLTIFWVVRWNRCLSELVTLKARGYRTLVMRGGHSGVGRLGKATVKR